MRTLPSILMPKILFICSLFYVSITTIKSDPITPAQWAVIEQQAAAVPRTELAFPGAQGAGAYSQGGRGGKVLMVTTLEDTGKEGSFRWAVSQNYPRIIQFKVGGTIVLGSSLEITNPRITIDGSTAPKPGITIKDGTVSVSATFDVVIGHMRFRAGDEVALKKGPWKKNKYKGKAPSDSLNVQNGLYVMIDHCSASWSSDEDLSVNYSKNVTVQNCFITEPLANPALHSGSSHAYGSLTNGDNISYLNNLVAYFTMRGPQMGDGSVEAINNLVCFYGRSGTRIHISSTDTAADIASTVVCTHQAIGNVYEYPLEKNSDIYLAPSKSDENSDSVDSKALVNPLSKIYIAQNSGPTIGDPSDVNQWENMESLFSPAVTNALIAHQPVMHSQPLTILPTDQVYNNVLNNSGATLPARDAVDIRIVKQIKAGKGNIIMSQDNVGGYPDVKKCSDENVASL